MLSFSFRAQAPSGKSVVDRINATTVKEAWALLEQQGYQDIELLDNEISAINLQSDTSIHRLNVTAQQEQARRQQKSIWLQIVTRFFLPKNSINFLILLALLGYGFVIHSKEHIVLASVMLVMYLLWFMWANVPSYLYNQALDASAWGRWQEVEKWMSYLHRWKNWFKTPFPHHEMLFRLATAQAAQGRLNEGLLLVSPLANDTSLAPGFYPCRLAALYLVSKNYPQAAECQREALKLNPSDSSRIDLAFTLVIRLNDFSTAQALLEEVDQRQMSPLARLYFCYCQAMIALGTQQPQRACENLEDFFAKSIAFYGSPLIQTTLLYAHAHYALALAEVGKLKQAKQHFETAYPMLLAHAETELIARCESSVNATK